ncbi:VOC family protein [uncultured Maritimibacter sp.]|jgi:glyoxalase family protein|uniref:VOC family protein n=1 Tax=uncultured Maritimibacter sp. TaxID=991866 RepID=UPI000AE63CDE|nr:VOC family protein [uncultured Maritimibacter sp.]
MIPHITGLHHVTAFAGPAAENNAFFVDRLGLRRVKVTVNFDNPEVYHLYYGDAYGTPGTVMTHFPSRKWKPGQRGAGEVAVTAFSVPKGSLDWWQDRVGGTLGHTFNEARLYFNGPDSETLALVETDDPRRGWNALPEDVAIRGFHSVALKVRDPLPTIELLTAMGFRSIGTEDRRTRMVMDGPAGVVDVIGATEEIRAEEGAGSVHHIAFATPDDDTQAEVRQAVIDHGLTPTEVRDRDYFHSIYFREPGGVLFEVATCDIGFAVDEPADALGEVLKLPEQHRHLRPDLRRALAPLPGLDMAG